MTTHNCESFDGRITKTSTKMLPFGWKKESVIQATTVITSQCRWSHCADQGWNVDVRCRIVQRTYSVLTYSFQ